ncbi:MAG: hypothetical protein ACJ72E_03495 [Marmoricola sp.]
MNRVARIAAAIGVVCLALGVLVMQSPAPAAENPRATTVTRLASGTSSVAKTRTVQRTEFAADGSTSPVDTRNIKMAVSATTNLRGRQELDVTWSGAHPTGGLAADVNSAAGINEEYPFVLLECRGVDSTSAAASKRISPETCWTQTWAERFNANLNTAEPAWRSDAYETPANRAQYVDRPTSTSVLSGCTRKAAAERWIPMVSESGKTYPGGNLGCAGQAPESSNVNSSGLPSNATYGITGTDGKGSAQFSAWTEDENATLGCSATVPCALVAVPVMGISCDPYGSRLPESDRPDADTAAEAASRCEAADSYTPGQVAVAGSQANLATSGALWWSASNWRNRITVPLTFAVSANVCSVVSKKQPTAIYGSMLLNELTAQWRPKFCTDKALSPFVHVQTADSSARTLLGLGNIDAAFSSRPPDLPYQTPTVQAPVAVTGFAISYVIDGTDGQPYTKLRLDPRLLAKLLSQSYPANSIGKGSDPAIAGNPVNITQDPEFQALNPGLPRYTAKEAAATLLSLSSDTDMVYALTSYLNADPDARKFLDGTTDPWGMVVNPAYRGIALPAYSWPLNDTNDASQEYIQGGNNPCYSSSPSPYLSLIANPVGFVSAVVLNMQYAISNVNTECPNGDRNDPSTLKLQIQGRQQPGSRFVLGVVPLSTISRYNLDAAALQSGPASGKTFVAPDDAGLKAAAAQLTADKDAKTWTVDYDAYRSTAGAKAYPGTMPVFADVPTKGLAKADAASLASFLTYAAGAGQDPGLLNGQLPPGYLPLTKADGLGDLAAYTARAASAVRSQKGFVPALDPADDAGTTVPGGSPAGGGGSGSLPTSVDGPTPSAATPPGASLTPSIATAFRTPGMHSRLGSFGLPLVLFGALALGLAGLLMRWSNVLVPIAVEAAGRARTARGKRAAR